MERFCVLARSSSFEKSSLNCTVYKKCMLSSDYMWNCKTLQNAVSIHQVLFSPFSPLDTHTHTPTHTHTHTHGCVYAARSSRQTKIAAPSPAVFINPSFSEVALLKLTPVITSLHLLHLQPSLQDMSTVPEGSRVQPPTGQTEPSAGRAAAPTRQGLNPQRPGFDSPLSLIKGPKNILKRLSTDFLPLREEPEVMFSPLSVGC